MQISAAHETWPSFVVTTAHTLRESACSSFASVLQDASSSVSSFAADLRLCAAQACSEGSTMLTQP